MTNLSEVRELLYKMQRPAIAPSVSSPFSSSSKKKKADVRWKLVYPHDWHKNDMVLFHNRGILHTVVGALKPDEVRAFHQCNLAASDDPTGPTEEDVKKWA